MTDTEKLRLREAFKMMQVAVAKSRSNAAVCSVFAMGCTALGWVLDEPHYREAFESTLTDLKRASIVVAPDPK